MRFDLIVVGGGSAGLVASAAAAGLGARVALIEEHRLGGECLWTGCVPSKALIACGRVAQAVRDAGRFGVRVPAPAIDFAAVRGWVRDAQHRIEPHDSAERFRGMGVEVIRARARFTGARTLDADGRTLTTKRVLIATGSKPAIPPIDGLDAVPYLTNETIFDLERQPRTMLVLGGGPIGLELAQAFARLGTHAIVVEMSPRLLPREDDELTERLRERLAAEGVTLLLGARATRAARDDGGGVALDISHDDGRTETLRGDALLVATGRVSNTQTIEAAAGGVEVSKEGVVVDEGLRTTADGVWAAGDVTGGLRFTHVAGYQAGLVIRNAFFPFRTKADYRVVPWVTFTEPELAHVGLTEAAARDAYGDHVRVWRQSFGDVDRAIVDGETSGLVKLVTDRKGRILGGHILGHGAGNLIAEVALAMKHGVRASALATTIHAYPTYPEAVREAAQEQLKSRLTGVTKSIARWFATR
ncbi:MAG: FAD-dependent oxidoreductase [Gemmatimonadota bacterium]|nr:FAD-dependent oxidoreductase [Gemmatimonadota bacterium]